MSEFDSIQGDREQSEGKPLPKKKEGDSKNNWYWEEVPFIPKGINNQDLLRFQGHIFIKNIVVEELKIKGEFKKKDGRYKKERSWFKKKKKDGR